MTDRINILSWARNCHYDGLIAVKERKGKRWMAALSHIEQIGNFDFDDFSSLDKSWDKIRETINNMTDEQLQKVDRARHND